MAAGERISKHSIQRLPTAPQPHPPSVRRMDILRNLKYYRELWQPGGTDDSQQAHDRESKRSRNQIRFTHARVDILIGLEYLEIAGRELKDAVTDERIKVWITNSTKALLFYILIAKIIYPLMLVLGRYTNLWMQLAVMEMQNLPPKIYLGVVSLLQWYPILLHLSPFFIATFRIFRYEKQIMNTANLRLDLKELLDNVKEFKEVPEDIPCLSDSNWDALPWELLRDF